MKKFFSLLIISIICLSVLSGCASGGSGGIVLRSNWNAVSGGDDVTAIYERLDYALSYDGSKKNNSVFELSGFAGTYSVILENTRAQIVNGGVVETDSGGEAFYKLSTEMNIISGEYKKIVGGETIDISGDKIETYVYFKATMDDLKPVESYRKGAWHSPSISGKIEKYESEIKTIYNNGIEVKVIKKSDNVLLEDFSQKNIKGFFLDNEQIFFGLRAFELKENFNTTFKVLSVFDRKVKTLSVKTPQKDAYKDFDLATMEVTKNNGDIINQTVKTVLTTIGIVDTFSGAATNAYYAVKSDGYDSFRSRAIRIESPLSYELGLLVYELKNVDESR